MSDNPKHAHGIAKASFQHIPVSSLIFLGQVMEYGANKYGSHNWRQTSIDPNIYYDAILRHLIAWRDGQYNDEGPKGSGFPHLAHIMACCAVVLDSDLELKTDSFAPHPPSQGSALKLLDHYSKPVEVPPNQQSSRDPQCPT